jgi:hypothetical protein
VHHHHFFNHTPRSTHPFLVLTPGRRVGMFDCETDRSAQAVDFWEPPSIRLLATKRERERLPTTTSPSVVPLASIPRVYTDSFCENRTLSKSHSATPTNGTDTMTSLRLVQTTLLLLLGTISQPARKSVPTRPFVFLAMNTSTLAITWYVGRTHASRERRKPVPHCTRDVQEKEREKETP